MQKLLVACVFAFIATLVIGASHSEAGLGSSGLGLPLGELGDGCATASSIGLYGASTLTGVQHGSNAGIARNVLDASLVFAPPT